jgi:hypothetical protein
MADFLFNQYDDVEIPLNAKILEIWPVYIFYVYHQHGQDKTPHHRTA